MAHFAKLPAWLASLSRGDKVTGRLSWRRLSLPAAYFTMIGTVAVATLIRLAIDPIVVGTQFPFFFGGVIICTLFGGVYVGLVSIVLSTLSAWYFLLSPVNTFVLVPGEAVSLVIFVIVAIAMVSIIGSLHSANFAIEESLKREIILAERAHAADELRLWSDIFHHTAIGIAIGDAQHSTVRSANKALAVMHGMQVSEMVGMDLGNLYAPGERHRCLVLQDAAQHTGHVQFEAERMRKDGSTFPAHVDVSAVREVQVDGEVQYLIATVQDITERRRIEDGLRQAQRLEAIGQLTAGIAHDFNNLLQGVIANLELVDDEIAVPPAAREYVGSAVRLAEEGGKLTSSLLSFSRRQLLLPKEVVLSDFLSAFQRMLLRTLDPRIRVEVIVEPGLAPVWIDPGHLQHALLNLAINARDAMPSGGTLRIEASLDTGGASGMAQDISAEGLAPTHSRRPHHCIVRVRDNGTGIAPENLKRVCEPFFSTKGVNGSGLGLSMVHGFVTQSGGDLRITSALGEGACVEVLLPLASTHTDAMSTLLPQ